MPNDYPEYQSHQQCQLRCFSIFSKQSQVELEAFQRLVNSASQTVKKKGKLGESFKTNIVKLPKVNHPNIEWRGRRHTNQECH